MVYRQSRNSSERHRRKSSRRTESKNEPTSLISDKPTNPSSSLSGATTKGSEQVKEDSSSKRQTEDVENPESVVTIDKPIKSSVPLSRPNLPSCPVSSRPMKSRPMTYKEVTRLDHENTISTLSNPQSLTEKTSENM